MNRVVRTGNVLLLSVLAVNLGFPLNWYSRAWGDSTSEGAAPISVAESTDQRQSSTGTLIEPSVDGQWPADWPFGRNYIQQTLMAIHGTLFKPVPAGQETVFYPTDEQINGTGIYTGVNNLGEQFNLDVIAFHQYASSEFAAGLTLEQLTAVASSGQRTGLFWGTMSTGSGSVNVTGFSMSWLYSPGGVAGGGPEFPLHGVMPLMDHDALMDYYYEDDPADPSDDFPFEILAEDQPNAKGDCPEPMKCTTCPPGSKSAVWCPCKDNNFRLAQRRLDNCLKAAKRTFWIQLAAASAVYAIAVRVCFVTAGAFIAICVAGASALYLVAVAAAHILYTSNASACYQAYNLDVMAAYAQGCQVE